MVEQKTLGKFEIDPEEVKKHYIDTGRMKESDFGQIIMDPQTHVMINEKCWVACLVEERPKYVSCGQCGKHLSFTEVDFATIKRMGEKSRVLYVEDAEKQRALDLKENQERRNSSIDAMLIHIRSDVEISIDSYSYKKKYIASILDGLEEQSQNMRNQKPVTGQVKICDSCARGTWWSTPPS